MPEKRATATAYYGSSIVDFLAEDPNQVIGLMTRASPFGADAETVRSWHHTIQVLRGSLSGISGHLFLEFTVPRIGSRIDAVVISDAAIIVVEFKVGATSFQRGDILQAWDYALDLKNFHSASHDRSIFPVLVATQAKSSQDDWEKPDADDVRRPAQSNPAGLAALLRRATATAFGSALDGAAWGEAPYSPSPSIVQAARALYARHSVESISRNDAGASNLSVTCKRVEEVIDETRASGGRSVIFVTGVPGAGKTLVGLNLATQHRRKDDPAHTVFLSGNKPLVDVLTEALVRDEVLRLTRSGEEATKTVVRQKVKAFLQLIHHWRDVGVANEGVPPDDHVVVFDESQRAWNRAKTVDFMRRKKRVQGFTQSEPEFLLSYMDRRRDWAVVVCLVGGGQEIHDGEAGIGGWLEALTTGFPHWRIFLSDKLGASEFGAADTLARLKGDARLTVDDRFHLASSLRSFRSGRISEFVRAVLDQDRATARATLGAIAGRYPIALTRSLPAARAWIRSRSRGSERVGLVVSSNAARLKPLAIDVRYSINPVHWFLNDSDDPRASDFLEDAATEFQIQGLEVDWACVTWDADLRMTSSGWEHHDFHGPRWRRMKSEERQRYLLNAYRVLLTRARQGMVIVVPEGSSEDRTRSSRYYDETFNYLRSLGIPLV